MGCYHYYCYHIILLSWYSLILVIKLLLYIILQL